MDALATQDDLDDLYGGDAVEAAGEAALSDEASENEAEVHVIQVCSAPHIAVTELSVCLC